MASAEWNEVLEHYYCKCGRQISLTSLRLERSGTWVIESWHHGRSLTRMKILGDPAESIAKTMISSTQTFFDRDERFNGCRWVR